MLKSFSNLINQNPLVFNLTIILLLSVLATLPVYIYGIPGGNDMYQHFQFAQTFYDSLLKGNLYPSLQTESNFGLGDVGVRFYPPLASYLFSFFRFITGNWFDGSCLFFISLFFVSGLGVYLWVKEWYSDSAALIGAVVYILAPYHFVQIYIGSLYAEFTAAAIVPFCFLFITRICQKCRWIDVLGLMFSFALLTLSHLPTLIMASLVFLIYSLLSLRKENYFNSLFKLGISVLSSLLLTAFYWVKMVTELDFVKHTDEKYYTGYYSFAERFVFPGISQTYRRLTSHNESLEFAALITLGILIPNLLLYLLQGKKERKYPMPAVLAITLFSFIMITPLSTSIWQISSVLQRIQFPYRWLILFSLGTAFICAASFKYLQENLKTSQRFLSFLTIGLMSLCIPYNILRTMNHFFYNPKDYFIAMINRNKTGASFECWWTKWVDADKNAKVGFPRPVLLADKVVANERSFEIKNWSPLERVFTINEGEAGHMQISTMYYPHWKATVNGQSVTVSPSEIGLVSFPITEEKSEVRLYFQEPSHVINAFYISGAAWIIFLILLISYTRKSTRQISEEL
jgi:hypothetical protein